MKSSPNNASRVLALVVVLLIVSVLVISFKGSFLPRASRVTGGHSSEGSSPDVYKHLVYLNRRPTNGWQNVKGKSSCGEFSLERTTDAKTGKQLVNLQPTKKVLAPSSVEITDVSFDEDCKTLYWIQDRQSIVALNLKTLKQQRISAPLSLWKDHALKIEGKTRYPSPMFLHAYGRSCEGEGVPFRGKRLLVSFEVPTTGKDGSSNFSIQANYAPELQSTKWQGQAWKLITKGGGIEPVLLDTERATLIMPEQVSGGRSARRHEIALVKTEDAFIGLAQPFTADQVCLYPDTEQDEAYVACRQKELDALFTDGHPELNAP